MNQFKSAANEMALLGAILRDNGIVSIILENAPPEFFHTPGHQKIYHSAIDLIGDGQPCTINTISAYLREDEEFASFGGEGYLARLLRIAAPMEMIVQICCEIVETSKLRRLRDAAVAAIREIEEQVADFATIAEKMLTTILCEAGKPLQPTFHPVSRILGEFSPDCLGNLAQAAIKEQSEQESALRLACHAGMSLGNPLPVAIFSHGVPKNEIALKLHAQGTAIFGETSGSTASGGEGGNKFKTISSYFCRAKFFVHDQRIESAHELLANAFRFRAEFGQSFFVMLGDNGGDSSTFVIA